MPGQRPDKLTLALASLIRSCDGDIDKALQAPFFNNFLDMTVHLYKVFSAGAVISSPVVDHGSLYFGSADGNVYAIH